MKKQKLYFHFVANDLLEEYLVPKSEFKSPITARAHILDTFDCDPKKLVFKGEVWE